MARRPPGGGGRGNRGLSPPGTKGSVWPAAQPFSASPAARARADRASLSALAPRSRTVGSRQAWRGSPEPLRALRGRGGSPGRQRVAQGLELVQEVTEAPQRYGRAALRWHGRYRREVRDVTRASRIPVCDTNKIPVSTIRSSSRFRPGKQCRLATFGISGSISPHSSSDTSGPPSSPSFRPRLTTRAFARRTPVPAFR